MITSVNLILLSCKTIEDYYHQIAENFIDGKVYLARKQFEQLSQKQRKGYFTFITDSDWKATASDAVYSYFFEIL
jgi:hypothetical protein